MSPSRVGRACLCAGLLATAAPAEAQPEFLTVSLLPANVSFSLAAGSASNPASLTIAATTSWSVLALRSAITVYGYFADATAALAHSAPNNTVDIPASRIEVSVNGGATVPFTQTAPFGGAGAARQLFVQPVSPVALAGSRTDTLGLNVNLAGYLLPADTYTGTLRIRAQATP